jgi:HPt (histidine-containing phosphotransfer) domain-containing protein
MVRRIGGDALLGEMVGLFTVQSRERLAVARAAVNSGDADGARRAFHSLKSSTAQLGATAASRACSDGEALARAGDIGALGPVLDALEPSVDRALTWLADAVREGSAA